jgi:hypothetical protein
MKSLMRMSKPPFNTNRREHANAAAGDGAVKTDRTRASLGFFEDALRTAHTTASDDVASAVLSGQTDSKPE